MYVTQYLWKKNSLILMLKKITTIYNYAKIVASIYLNYAYFNFLKKRSREHFIIISETLTYVITKIYITHSFIKFSSNYQTHLVYLTLSLFAHFSPAEWWENFCNHSQNVHIKLLYSTEFSPRKISTASIPSTFMTLCVAIGDMNDDMYTSSRMFSVAFRIVLAKRSLYV